MKCRTSLSILQEFLCHRFKRHVACRAFISNLLGWCDAPTITGVLIDQDVPYFSLSCLLSPAWSIFPFDNEIDDLLSTLCYCVPFLDWFFVFLLLLVSCAIRMGRCKHTRSKYRHYSCRVPSGVGSMKVKKRPRCTGRIYSPGADAVFSRLLLSSYITSA